MNLKVYEKTRYQNIYRHKKNKNYIIMMSNPVKTSIASIDGKKIMKLDDAIKIRDNPKIKLQKSAEINCGDDFDGLWDKYINHCKYEQKLAYNTILKKNRTYNKYFKNKLDKKVVKLTKSDIAKFISELECTDKQKNHVLKELKAFFNYLVSEEILLVSPTSNIKNYKIEKEEMKYWTPQQLKVILNLLNKDCKSELIDIRKKAYLVKTFILIGFSLGDRVGETRALTYDCFDETLLTVKIKHSINYDRNSNDFLSNTKNYHSQREIEITKKLIDSIKEYKYFLINDLGYPVKDNDIIFFNYSTRKPYSDTVLRKKFYYYCEKAKVPKIRMYDLRHTYVATMMAEGKELYHISRRVGHSNYNTTVNKYGHLSTEIRKEIAMSTDKYI